MGYYTGSGVVVGGGQTNNCLRTFAIMGGGSFAIRQRNVYSVTRKAGVSLADAQGESSSDSLSAVWGGSGSLAWIIFDAEGTRKVVSYDRIGDSNLYEMNITNETLSAWRSSTSGRTP